MRRRGKGEGEGEGRIRGCRRSIRGFNLRGFGVVERCFCRAGKRVRMYGRGDLLVCSSIKKLDKWKRMTSVMMICNKVKICELYDRQQRIAIDVLCIKKGFVLRLQNCRMR